MSTITYSQLKDHRKVAEDKVKEVTEEEAEIELTHRLSSGYSYKFGKRFYNGATLYKMHPSGILLLITIMF